MHKDNGRGLENYRAKNNARSLDGLPGLKAARKDKGEILLLGDARARASNLGRQWMAVMLGMLLVLAVLWVAISLGIVEIKLGEGIELGKRLGEWRSQLRR